MEPDDEWLDSRIRFAFEEIALPPERLKALAAAGRPRKAMPRGLVAFAAVLVLALAAWPIVQRANRTPSSGAEPVLVAAPLPEVGEVRITADTPALVYVDDKLRGFTPLSLRLAPGPHKVHATVADQARTTTVTVVDPAVPLDVVFSFTSGDAEKLPALAGLWVGSTAEKRSFKLVILGQRGNEFWGTVDVQNEDGTLRSVPIKGTVELSGALSFEGPGATFTGLVTGRRATGTFRPDEGPEQGWTAVH